MITALDHIAFAVGDEAAMLEFYRRLGFELGFQDWNGLAVASEHDWRAAGYRLWSVQVGEIKVWFVPYEIWRGRGWTRATLHAPEARPGTADLCFVWRGTVEQAQAHLVAAGVAVIDGPVERQGGADGGRRRGTSVYFRDPDENLLELIVYG